MATRKPMRPEPRAAELSAEQMRAAIPKLQWRIKDLEDFDPKSLGDRNDPRVDSLDTRIIDTLADVFGNDTIEFARHQPRPLDSAGFFVGYDTPLHEIIESIEQGRAREIERLKNLVAMFEEKIGDAGESPTARARRSFDDLDLDPAIADACRDRFMTEHYADAVETACKVLNNLVQNRSGRFDLDGVALMQQVFSPNKPVLRFNDQTNDTEKSEQQGMMWLFAGAMSALRNPRAHTVMQDHPEQAVEHITFVSMLAKALSRTRKG